MGSNGNLNDEGVGGRKCKIGKDLCLSKALKDAAAKKH